jgi:outer membrane protein TolC
MIYDLSAFAALRRGKQFAIGAPGTGPARTDCFRKRAEPVPGAPVSALFLALFLATGDLIASAQPADTNSLPIDLPTALRLAGAQNLDVQIARENLNEAEARHQSAVEGFFPWVSPGIVYHRRDGVAQASPSGQISDANYQSYAPGVTAAAQLDFGNAIYTTLAARQLVKASDQAIETQRQDAALAAAHGYFELVKAKALVGVVNEAIQVSQDYQQQLREAVTAGIAFKGDELRVQTQTEHFKITLQQALAQQRAAAVKLARVLHLDPTVDLVPLDTGLTSLTLSPTNASMSALVAQALRDRSELKQSQALTAASRDEKNGAVYGPLIPSLGAQVFGGGLGGGPEGSPGTFDGMADYIVGLSWRIGPGGLFDSGRIKASKARMAATELAHSKLKDTITSQVVDALVEVNSTATQIHLAEQNLNTASETLQLTQQRKQFGVGIVLEDIQAQQALTQARSDYITALADYNRAQYALSRAIGGL